MAPLLLALLAVTSGRATTVLRAESLVVGANVVVLLGDPPAHGRRLGAGVDLWYQMQRYAQEGEYYGDDYVVWARERPDLNWGPALHAWRAGGTWSASLEMRAGVTWPLRMGLQDGWWPGPGLTAQAGPVLSTAGWVGLDLQVAADLPWVQGRIAAAWAPGGLREQRLHLGVFSPLEQPHLWEESENVVWDPNDLEE
jgi:hypothetical protein